MKMINENQLAMILEDFSPLVCWKVGLAYGSMIYFEMNDKLKQKERDGTYRDIGSATLWLEGDNWSLYRSGREMTTSDEVTRNFVESIVQKYFLGQRLVKVERDNSNKALSIYFSNGLKLFVWQTDEDQLEELDDLVIFHLPDGTIVCFNVSQGWYVSNEVDEFRAFDWVGRHIKIG